jgi:hypothetical protein
VADTLEAVRRCILWLLFGEGILTYGCDHLDQQLSLAWLPYADVLHLPPAIGQGVVADDCFCVVRHVVMRVYCFQRSSEGDERSRDVSYKQTPKTSCCCQNSADHSAVVGGTNSSRPIKSNEGLSLSLSLGRDERVQAFACKQLNNSIFALGAVVISARMVAYRYQIARRYMQNLCLETLLLMLTYTELNALHVCSLAFSRNT